MSKTRIKEAQAINNIYLGKSEVMLLIEGLEELKKLQPQADMPDRVIDKLIAKGQMRR